MTRFVNQTLISSYRYWVSDIESLTLGGRHWICDNQSLVFTKVDLTSRSFPTSAGHLLTTWDFQGLTLDAKNTNDGCIKQSLIFCLQRRVTQIATTTLRKFCQALEECQILKLALTLNQQPQPAPHSRGMITLAFIFGNILGLLIILINYHLDDSVFTF